MVSLAPPRVRSLALLAAVSVAAACGAERGEPTGGTGSAAGSGAPAASAAAEREASEHPIIALDAMEIRLDGAVVPLALERDGSPAKLDALHSALKSRRDAWRAAHPSAPFPGVYELRIAGDPPIHGLKTVVESAAYAAYPYARARGIPGVEGDVELSAQIPGPPSRDDLPVEEAPRSLHLHLSGGTARLVWRARFDEDAPESVVSSAVLPSAVCEQWAKWGAHKQPSDRALDQAVLHTPHDARVSVLGPAIAALRACTRAVDGEPAPVSVFTLTFALN